jgi:hypothetical protein
VIESDGRLVIAWGVGKSKGAFQSAYEIGLSSEGKKIYESGLVKSSRQEAYLDQAKLPFGKRIDITVTVTDDLGNVSDKLKDGRMTATPMTYRVDFSNTSVDSVIQLQ